MQSQPPTELRYFRLPPGKKGPPVVKRFYDLAVPFEDFDRGDYNVGVSTTGLLVVDVDATKDGFESLDTLEMAYGDLPQTYTVTTPRGGQHRYFKPPHDVANSGGKLGKGIDIRGHHGYVVGAGSITEVTKESAAGEYKVLVNAPIADAPQWLVDLCDRPKERDAGEVAGELDTPQGILRAGDYLRSAATAVQGAGGNNHTFKTAAAVLDFGLSSAMAFTLMSEGGWNDGCQPPWAPEELEHIVDNAWQYRLTAVGSSDPRQEFDEWHAPPTGLEPYRFTADRLGLKPPRPWLLGNLLMERKVTAIVAPGGTGKTMIGLTAAIAVAAKRDLLGMPTKRQRRAWVFNNEDDTDELERRVKGLLNGHNVDLERDIGDRLFINSGEKARLRVAFKDKDTMKENKADIATIKRCIVENEIGLFIVDPLISISRGGSESSNDDAEFVFDILRSIAQDTGCAMLIVHHTRKPNGNSSDGDAGNANLFRGASAGVDASRVVATLTRATEKEMERHRWPMKDRRRYIRLDIGKENMSLSDEICWFRLDSVKVESTDPNEPDWVGVPRYFKPVEVTEEVDLVDSIVTEALGDNDRLTMREAVKAVRDNAEYAGSKDPKAVRQRLRDCMSAVWEVRKSGPQGSPGAYAVCRIEVGSVDSDDTGKAPIPPVSELVT